MPNISVSTESLQSLLSSFTTAHDTLTTTTANMTSSLAGCEWQSPAAEDFRGAWRDQYQPSLAKLLGAIENFNGEIQKQLARYNANEGLG
jgi:uncharacterized protein YukE